MLGDSLTEGYGVKKENAYPALVEKKLHADGKTEWKVVNAGISGSTSASALSRVKWVSKSQPKILFLALGANDGLRGLPNSSTKKNLQAAIHYAKEQGIKVFLAGMMMPPNYGKEYTKSFEKIFPELAKAENIPLLPFLLQDVGGISKLNQTDGIHPNEAGHKIIATHVYDFLKDKL